MTACGVKLDGAFGACRCIHIKALTFELAVEDFNVERLALTHLRASDGERIRRDGRDLAGPERGLGQRHGEGLLADKHLVLMISEDW